MLPTNMLSWLWASHQQVEGEGNDEQEAERGGKCLVGCSRHENVLIFINADHVIRHWWIVDVMSGYGTWGKINTGILAQTANNKTYAHAH